MNEIRPSGRTFTRGGTRANYSSPEPDIHAIDLFAGAGGLSLGLERAGFGILAANEIEPDFCETYRLNHNHTIMMEGDIHDIDFTALRRQVLAEKRLHLLAGGPPCQGFSTVGKKDEFDPRNSLFQQFLRAIGELEPEFVLFENVSGFAKMYKGRIFHSLQQSLDEMGYDHTYALLNAVDFGLPQYRQRTIMVGYKRGRAFRMPQGTFSSPPDLFGRPSFRTLRMAISDLPLISSGGEATEYLCSPENDYQKLMRQPAVPLSEHIAPKHGEQLLKVIRSVPPGGCILDVPLELRPRGYFSNTYARLVWDRPAPTITRNFGTPSSSRCIHPVLDRGLTTREGARLQGFPDWYRFSGGKGSKNLQIGNAVPPIFGYEIGRAIRAALEACESPAIEGRTTSGPAKMVFAD